MRTLAVIIGILLFLCLSSVISSAQINNAKEIVKKADEKMRGKTSKSEMTIQIIRPTWIREIKMKTWSS